MLSAAFVERMDYYQILLVCFTNNLYICSPVIAGNLFKIKV